MRLRLLSILLVLALRLAVVSDVCVKGGSGRHFEGPLAHAMNLDESSTSSFSSFSSSSGDASSNSSADEDTTAAMNGQRMTSKAYYKTNDRRPIRSEEQRQHENAGQIERAAFKFKEENGNEAKQDSTVPRGKNAMFMFWWKKRDEHVLQVEKTR